MEDFQKFKITEEEYPMGRRWKAVVRSRAWFIGEFSRVLYERFGEEGLKAISEVFSNAAKATFLPGLKSFRIEGRGALSLCLFFYMANTLMGNKMEMDENSNEKRATVRMYKCPPFPEPNKVKDMKKYCDAMFAFERTAAALSDPRMKISTGGCLISKGDAYCEITAELTDEG